MNITLTIFAWGGGETAFQQHRKYWDALEARRVKVISPINSPIKECPYDQKLLGNAEHAGRDSIKRIKSVLHELQYMDFATHHMICEQDSIPLNPDFKLQSGLTGIIQENYEPARFISSRYVNQPQLIDHASLLKMLTVAEEYPAVWEEGFADRYVSALAFLAGVPILSWDPPGFSRNTILPLHHHDMGKAIHNGTKMIHGIKDPETLAIAEKFLTRKV